jgi:hypothetical protein
MPFAYTVSLQVFHPNSDPKEIAAGIGLPSSRSWMVGEQRATPKGTRLPGTYSDSYCVFPLGGGDDGELADFLRVALRKLEQVATFISEIRRTGGKLNLFVSWSVGDRGEVFDVELLAQMARIGVDLGIDPISSS